jgi:hypothetical protein
LVAATDGSRIPQASITLSGPDGFRRAVSATADGTFSIVELPSGTYAVQASAPGFTTTTQSSVAVAIGRNTQLTFTLTVIGTSQTVNVSAEKSSFDTTETSSVVNIDRDRIEELPIPNRNYLTFVALSPQAAPANPVLSQQTLAQSSGGFGFGGLRPSSNAVHIDGVACGEDKGPAILYLRQQEACEEVMGQMIDAESSLKTLRRSRVQVVALQARI